jgi:hypothetical protein
MTVRQVAEATGAAYSTVAAYAQKAGWTENGKQTLLDERQTAIIVEAMKQAQHNQTKYTFQAGLEGIETAQSRAVRIAVLAKRQQEIDRQIKAELEAEIAELRTDNTRLQIKCDTHETYLTVKRVAKLNGLSWSALDWKRVKRSSQALELSWERADDLNYGTCNAYHVDAWRDAYPNLRYPQAPEGPENAF